MNTLYYRSPHHEVGQRLQKTVESVMPMGVLEVFHSLADFCQRLRRIPLQPPGIAVLFAETRDELSEFIGVRDLLKDLRIILVLPDLDEETVSRGHALYPRYLTYVSSDFGDVQAVLERMLKQVYGTQIWIQEHKIINKEDKNDPRNPCTGSDQGCPGPEGREVFDLLSRR
ncbi:MAG: hypothetical protein K9M96_18115 [Deltaproteobacteria bacterium]|nr:hypothetical protein [Deltaproteobacteria bacterium]